jgi:hypothetical protein
MQNLAKIMRDYKPAKDHEQKQSQNTQSPEIKIIIREEEFLEGSAKQPLGKIHDSDKNVNGQGKRKEDREAGKEIFFQMISINIMRLILQ